MFGTSKNDPIINTTQCDQTDFITILPVELKGRQFPMEKDVILENLKDSNLHAVRTMVNYKCQAWCLFSVVQGDLVIHRMAVKDENYIDEVLESLFSTITYTPKKQGCHVSLNWPEYGTDDFLFKALLADGWQTAGLIPDVYFAYGEYWDGIKLEKQF